MHPLLKKLNYKNDPEVYVLNAPAHLEALNQIWPEGVQVKYKLGTRSVSFVLVFCTLQEEVNQFAERLHPLAKGDAILWFCYPKGSSKKYACGFNRDTGWQQLGALGWEPVRQVAIDADWSALRFRNPDFIKKMTRSFAMTEKGKRKVAGE